VIRAPHQTRIKRTRRLLPLSRLCVSFAALVCVGCVYRGAQEDNSLFGDSAIARRVLPATYTDRGDRTDRDLEEWVMSNCLVTDRESVIACGRQIGMTCEPKSLQEPECVFIGITRVRAVEYAVSPSFPGKIGAWGQGAAVVKMAYAEPRRVSVDYEWFPEYSEDKR
jgi:hypothetical protein